MGSSCVYMYIFYSFDFYPICFFFYIMDFYNSMYFPSTLFTELNRQHSHLETTCQHRSHHPQVQGNLDTTRRTCTYNLKRYMYQKHLADNAAARAPQKSRLAASNKLMERARATMQRAGLWLVSWQSTGPCHVMRVEVWRQARSCFADSARHPIHHARQTIAA